MTDFNDYLQQQLKDPELKKEYDTLEPAFSNIQAQIDACKNKNTARLLAELEMGMASIRKEGVLTLEEAFAELEDNPQNS